MQKDTLNRNIRWKMEELLQIRGSAYRYFNLQEFNRKNRDRPGGHQISELNTDIWLSSPQGRKFFKRKGNKQFRKEVKRLEIQLGLDEIAEQIREEETQLALLEQWDAEWDVEYHFHLFDDDRFEDPFDYDLDRSFDPYPDYDYDY